MSTLRCACAFLGIASVLLAGAPARSADLSDVRHEVLAFYYGWYSGDWVNTARFTPVDGSYQSMDPKQAERQAKLAAQAGITGLVADWAPSRGRYTDAQMPVILAAARKYGLRMSALLTKFSAEPTTPDVIVSDVSYLIGQYGSDPAWLKVGGKPVVFVYGTGLMKLNTAAKWDDTLKQLRARLPGLVVLADGQTDPLHIPQQKAAFDGTFHYTEVPNIRNRPLADIESQVQKADQYLAQQQNPTRIFCLTVSPGYDDSQTTRAKPRPVADRYDGETYRATWRAAIAANPDWILINTFNEWIEGSQIEPSVEFGSQAMQDTAAFARQFVAQPSRRANSQ